MTNSLVMIFVGFLVVAFLYEARRKKPTGPQAMTGPAKDAGHPFAQPGAIADEAMPTQTGRFRAQQVINAPKKELKDAVVAKPQDAEEPEEEEVLPDPFDNNSER